MKNTTKLGIIALLATFSLALLGCGEKGGVIEVTNGLSDTSVAGVTLPAETINVIVEKSLIPNPINQAKTMSSGDKIEPGESKTYTFDEDGIYQIYYWHTSLLLVTKNENVEIKGGETKTVTIK